jgi:anhydro-N-acetylmuramic acid kinase
MQPRLIAGAMSGTSADGVDVAIVRTSGRGMAMTAQLLRHHQTPYDSALRARIFALREHSHTSLAEFASLGKDISLTYAQAVNTAAEGFEPLAAIAAHGQTLFHAPPLTLQWLDPALLAARTQTTVVSDFRRADCAAGGQGAPLVPFADYLLFQDSIKRRVLLNIGGIANITYIPANSRIERLMAFDTGPGNCISDMLMRPAAACDAGGERAARGHVISSILDSVLADPWFSAPPPKSTDGPAMIRLFERSAPKDVAVNDLLRTACEISGRSIAQAIRQFCPSLPDELIVSGGGVHNRTLMDALRRHLPTVGVLTTDELGVPSEAKEAIAFALLGAATLDGEPSNVPSCTGARHAVILGSITPAPLSRRGHAAFVER